MKLKLSLFVSILFILSGCNIVQVEEEKRFSLASDGIDSIQLSLSYGDVQVIGETDRTEIEVVATFFAYGEEMEAAADFLDKNLQLTLEKKENQAVLQTKIDRSEMTTNDGRLHLVLYVPNSLAIHHRQESGMLSVQHVRNEIDIVHGAGNIEIVDVEGNIKIVDSVGTITAENVIGDIEINNNSGQLTINDLVGNAKLIAGKGDLAVNHVTGNVTLRSGSGSVDMDGVKGNVDILENAGGEINITNVEGTITE
ncbi:DUF4097 family beta strand repeat-containing protein [Alkalihalobacterium bogoriense]|uniref:DUF4097 family beta strand repeat-containing protein n=1 Tax=Alkalihalobacterium bogoriense TaxID=246272 RepID=UPI00047A4F92|nr:DUF4097 family beta strand repeat-containing protein [Alkalihalobacterium bogoriense]